MAISDTIAALSSVLDETRAELTRVEVRIGELEQERYGILNAPPHADDIVAAFRRGLAVQADTFERQLADHLKDVYAVPGSASAVEKPRAPELLRVETKAAREERLGRMSTKGVPTPDLNVAALTYFLSSKISGEIPELVDKLCPGARDGMKSEERRNRLAEIDRNIATLNEDRARLLSDLNAVRMKFAR